MIKAVLFDLDGTLLDTSEGIKHSVRYTLSKMGYDELPEETILKFVGPTIQNSLMSFCGVDAEEAQKGANVFRDFYKSEALFEASLYDGIIELLQELKGRGVRIGVATYKREDYALDLLHKFGITEYCDVIHGADNDNKLTKADIVEMCISELGADKSEVILVGDTEHDAKGAYEARVKFVAVTWGFGYEPNNCRTLYPCLNVINTTSQLLDMI